MSVISLQRFILLLSILLMGPVLTGCLPDSGGGRSRLIEEEETTSASTEDEEEEEEEEETPSRPEGVNLEPDFCACKESKAYNIGNCTSFCSGKDDEDLTLYVNVTLESDILLNESLGDLYNWCNVELTEDELTPSCTLYATYNNSDEPLPEVTITSGSEQFTADITTLDFDKTYLIYLQENVSEVKSSYIQLRLKEPEDEDDEPLGPLQITPLNLYTCIARSGTVNSGDNYYEYGAQMHYMYPDYDQPPPLPATTDGFWFCHDINRYGSNDDIEYPRLYEWSNYFHFWASTDIRFYDQDESGKLDVNEVIEERLLDEYGVSGADINLFAEFPWYNYPLAESAVSMGYVMQPWMESDGDPFCPNNDHYGSSDPVFQILGDMIGAETEGLYISVRENLTFENSDGEITEFPDDYLLIRENLLNQIWFYLDDDGTPVPADENASVFKSVMFYWPPDTSFPLTKKSYQSTYIVRSPDQISSEDDVIGDLRTIVTPSDKRIGCIPKLQ